MPMTKDDLWLKAALVGGLWASIEIVIGSFLHNLRIPFAGSILAAQGTILLIAYFQVWPQKGLIWRAGLICALMKSASPSSVILGPMIGILLEAIIIELSVLFLGKNLLAYIAGGALSVLSALVHKIAGLLILYGSDIIVLYLKLYDFALDQVQIRNNDPVYLLLILVALYSVIGAMTAVAGYKIGKSAPFAVSSTEFLPDNFIPPRLTPEIMRNRYSKYLLFLHFFIIPAGLLYYPVLARTTAVIAVGTYAGFCFLWYPGILKRLLKPVFWLHLMALMLLSAFFWDPGEGKAYGFHPGGLTAGIDMCLRAIFVVVAFSSLSKELSNPWVGKLLNRYGFNRYRMALAMAFGILPHVIGSLPRPREFLLHPFRSYSGLIKSSEKLFIKASFIDNYKEPLAGYQPLKSNPEKK